MPLNRKDAPSLQSRLFLVDFFALHCRVEFDNFTKRKNTVDSQIFKICFLVRFFSSKHSLKCFFLIFSVLVLHFYSYTRYRNVLTDQQLQRVNLSHSSS